MKEERYVEVDLGRDNESDDDESDVESTNNDDDQSYYSYEDYYSYFNTYGYYNEEDDFDAYEDNFSSWEKEREARRRAHSEFHKQQVRLGNDFRDGKASTQSDTCMFCGKNTAITESSAEENGINWEEYIESTQVETFPGYITCWACKSNHISVLTEKKACSMFAKKLNIQVQSNYGQGTYNPIFWLLRRNGRSFHHQPVTNMYDGAPRNSVFYWYPDLEREALARGWKPRGDKKKSVPWQRKDMLTSIVSITPGTLSLKKRRKTDESDDDDRKPSAKPRKLF